MLINYLNPGRKLFFPGKIFILILTVLLISCSSASVKKELSAKTDSLMESLISGNYSGFPEIESALNSLDPSESENIKNALSGIEDWKTEIKILSENRAAAEVKADINKRQTVFIFTYSTVDNEWVLDEKISLKQNIEVIPFIGLEQD